MPKRKRRSKNKAAFILNLSSDLPGKEVVERARAAGIELTEQYVYIARSNARKKAGMGRGRKKAAAVSAPDGSSACEREFRRLAVEMGVSKADAVLEETKKRLAKLIEVSAIALFQGRVFTFVAGDQGERWADCVRGSTYQRGKYGLPLLLWFRSKGFRGSVSEAG
jgi:hypothetical protein